LPELLVGGVVGLLGVALGGLEVFVAEAFADRGEADAVVDQLSRVRMSVMWNST
jgi:hypothetical protein